MLDNIRVTINTVNDQVRLNINDPAMGAAKISADAGNIIERKTDGLFAPDTAVDKVDKVTGRSLVDNDEIAKLLTVEQDAQKNTVSSVAGKQGDVELDKSDVGLGAVDNTSDADKPVSTAVDAALANKVDKVAGKQLSDENYTLAEKDKLGGIDSEATKNRADSENADKVHSHTIGQVDGLSAALLTKFDKTDVVQSAGQSTEKVMSQKAVTDELDAINLLIGDTSAALDAINGEVI